MLSFRQIRAARALLGWQINELAERAGLTRRTLWNIEADRHKPTADTMQRIERCFTHAGVEFTDQDGLRLKRDDIETFIGPVRFGAFTDFTYEQIKQHGGDVCLSVSDERLFSKYRRNTPEHYQRMQDLFNSGVLKSFRILANQSNFTTTYNYNTYKWQPETSFAPTAFYVFGDCLALVSFVHSTPPYVAVLRSAPLADAYRIAFDAAWQAAKPPPKRKERRS
jgi:transcriptional regulator with XRE-family HTH domain